MQMKNREQKVADLQNKKNMNIYIKQWTAVR